MIIRNNLLKGIARTYIKELNFIYDQNESEAMISLLIEHLFGYSRTDLSLSPDIRLSESEILKFNKAFKQLKKFKPVQYVTGIADFMDFKFEVSPKVLIPRQETEELVDLIRRNELSPNQTILDIGTGTGCIAISLYHYLNEPQVHAIDIDPGVVEIARRNSLNNNANISFYQLDILKGNDKLFENQFDVIVSNPPYVTQSDKKQMSKNVVNFEPDLALYVSDDNPLEFYNAILTFSKLNLRAGGRVYFEINESLGMEMIDLMKEFSYINPKLHNDLNSKSRFISGTKPEE